MNLLNQHQAAASSFWALNSGVHYGVILVSLRYALCGKTVLERLQFRYFSGPSSHHQAYAAVAGDSDGHSAFRVSQRSLSVSVDVAKDAS